MIGIIKIIEENSGKYRLKEKIQVVKGRPLKNVTKIHMEGASSVLKKV